MSFHLGMYLIQSSVAGKRSVFFGWFSPDIGSIVLPAPVTWVAPALENPFGTVRL